MKQRIAPEGAKASPQIVARRAKLDVNDFQICRVENGWMLIAKLHDIFTEADTYVFRSAKDLGAFIAENFVEKEDSPKAREAA